MYEAVQPGTVILLCPWAEDGLSGVPRQDTQYPQTHQCSAQRTGQGSITEVLWHYQAVQDLPAIVSI